MIASLFADCVIPGCSAPVAEAGDACTGCRRAFGHFLRITEQPAITAEQIAARDDGTRQAYRQMRDRHEGERKQNQTCWMCEERRTCTRTPRGWECPSCTQIDG